MGDESAIVAAARTFVLGESKGPEKDKALLFYLIEHKHTSPFEHVIFKFRVRCPVIVFWQWVRHRTWSFSVEAGGILNSRARCMCPLSGDCKARAIGRPATVC
jgi:thymidylate synthase ThyX